MARGHTKEGSVSLTYAEFCAGYGGLGLAVEEVFGAELKWYSEFDAAPSRVMARHWPGVPNHGDMTAIDWNAVEHVDILSGGTPCQDLSGAGRRKGMTEGSRSNLAVEFLRAVEIIRPKYVIWENVRGAYSACADSEMGQCPGCVDGRKPHQPFLRAIGRLLGNLSDLGYDCQWRGLRAADVGGCHARYRVFILATDTRRVPGESRRIAGPREAESGRSFREPVGRSGTSFADVGRVGLEARRLPSGQAAEVTEYHHGFRVLREYAAAVERWAGLTRPYPDPVIVKKTGKLSTNPAFVEWMMGLPDGWVTAPEIGLTRNEQLKACGNGVVPQQAIAALRDMTTMACVP